MHWNTQKESDKMNLQQLQSVSHPVLTERGLLLEQAHLEQT
jgi:hypothetical protein